MHVQSSQDCQSDLILNDLVEKIARLPAAARADIMPDIERLRACHALNEQALRESEEHFQLLADSNPLLIWMTDAQGGNLFINQTYREYLGVTIDEVYGLNWQNYLHPDDALGYITAFQQANSTQSEFHCEGRVRRVDGAWRWIASTAQPRFSTGGEFLGHVGHSMDITDDKLAEETLAKAYNDLAIERNRLLAMMEAIPIGISILDRDGGVIQTNQAFDAIWGSPRPPAKSVDDYEEYQAWWVDTGQPVRPEEWASARAVRKGETVTGQLMQIQRFNGDRGTIINSGAPIRDARGEITGSAVAIMDITGQKQLEKEQQEQAVQIEVQLRLMEQREQERCAIAKDLHDGPIQTLASITFQLHMIKEVFPDPALQDELNNIKMEIKNTINELREVMNDLRPPALMHFGFARVMQLYTEDFSERFPEIEIALDMVGKDQLLSDQARLTLFRIYQAGINNIVRHSGASKAWVTYQIDQNTFRLELRDNGAGFAPCQDFSQFTRDGHFGLVGMKERAEAIGGTFALTSEPGKGTTVVVQCPLEGANLR